MEASSKRFEEYVSLMAQSLGHADRVEPFRGYCTGLMLPVKRKSVEPMAAHLSPERVCSEHQRLHHFVADAAWSDLAVLDSVRGYVLEQISPRSGPPEAMLIDDTGFPKKGKHSVGVTRQYCGQLGKQDNCQVAVSVSLGNENFSLPVRYQLYLPQSWADDADRRKTARSPAAGPPTRRTCRKAGPITRTGVSLRKSLRRWIPPPSRCWRCNCLKTS